MGTLEKIANISHAADVVSGASIYSGLNERENVSRPYFKHRASLGLRKASQMSDDSSHQTTPLPEELDIKRAHAIIDTVIITMKPEEFAAILRRFPPIFQAFGELQYNVANVIDAQGQQRFIAIVRTPEQGDQPAQATATKALYEVEPKMLVLLGIAGGKPDLAYTLGDIIVANRMYNFSFKSINADGTEEYGLHSEPAHALAQRFASNIEANKSSLGNWNTEAAIGMSRPVVDMAEERIAGPEKWRDDIRKSLAKFFGPNAQRREPIAVDGPVGSASTLLKHPETMQKWLHMARDLKACDMEITGVFEAAGSVKGKIPIVVVRALSDIVGFKRDELWTEYACHSAASFCKAMLIANSFRLQPKPAIPTSSPSEDDASKEAATASRPILSPLSGVNFVRLGRDNYQKNGAFSFSLTVNLLLPGRSFVFLGFEAAYVAPDGCYCLNLDQTIQVNDRILVTAGNYLDFKTPETISGGIAQIMCHRRVRPPLMIQTPADCDYGDVRIRIRLMQDDIISEHDYFFTFKVGGDLIAIDKIREPPILPDAELMSMREAGVITSDEFDRAYEIRDLERYQIVRFGDYIDTAYLPREGMVIPVGPDLVKFLKDLAQRRNPADDVAEPEQQS
jgi:nucleoside phosphorylase